MFKYESPDRRGTAGSNMATAADALAVAWQCFHAGDLQQAGTLALQIRHADAQQVGASQLLGTITLAQGQLAEAAQYFREVLGRQPDDADTHNSLGVALARQGKLAEALPHFQEVLRLNPASAEAHNNLALVLKDQGQPAEAERLFRHVLQISPDFRAVHNNLGLALKEQGKLDEALASLERARQLDPGTPETHQNLGLVLKAKNRMKEAEASFRQALHLRPTYAEAHGSLGNLLRELERLDEAEASCRQALVFNPLSGEAHNNLALVLKEQDKLDQALIHLQQGLRLKPRSAEIHNNLGLLLQKHDKPDEALASFRQALNLDNHFIEVYSNLGSLLADLERFPEAEACLQEAIRLKPDSVPAHLALGGVWQLAGNLEEAETRYRYALDLNPDSIPAHLALGGVLQQLGRLAEAEARFRYVLDLKPDARKATRRKADTVSALLALGGVLQSQGKLAEAEARFQHASDLHSRDPEVQYASACHALLQGDFERGWADYDARLRLKNEARFRRRFRQPEWDGADLAGRTILLYTEQGLGDTMQFIRYAPLVKERGGTVVCEVQAVLLPLLSRCAGIDRLIPQGESLPDFACQLSLMSLPRIFGTTLATVPARVPYLAADPELVEKWRQELAPLSGLKIGIGWQGFPRQGRDRLRSFPLAKFEPLARLAGVHLLSLQKGAGTEQIPAFAARFPLTDLGARLDTTGGAFMDTAAVLPSLDLVITSDTALAHLAGAVGVPVWLAVAKVPEWRWLLDREDSPWYPTMRLFRQSRPGEWEGVFERMAAAVKTMLPR